MTFPFIKRSLPQPLVIIPLLLVMLWLSGCENSPIRRRTTTANATNIEPVYDQIRRINPIELDRCRVLPGPPPVIAANNAPSSSIGGGTPAPTSRDEENAWESAVNNVEDQLFGDEAGAAPSNNAYPSTNTPYEPELTARVTSANVLSRENINYATIQVDPNTLNTATINTRGIANVVREVPRRNRIQIVEEESVRVNLTYMLTKVGNWRCDGVYVEVADLGTGDTTTRRAVGSDGRIGW